MSQYHRAALEKYVRSTNAREPIDWYFAPGYVYHGPMGTLDKDAFLEQHGTFLRAFPDVRMTVLDIVTDGDKAATRWLAEGTHGGELMGIAATGRRIRVTGIVMTRFVEGRAAEEWEEIDMAGLMRQLGESPTP